MRVVHSDGLSLEERDRRKSGIFAHVCDSAKAIAQAMDDLGIAWSDAENCLPCVGLLNAAVIENIDWDNSLLMACKTLWADAGFQRCFARAHEYQLNDNAD